MIIIITRMQRQASKAAQERSLRLQQCCYLQCCTVGGYDETMTHAHACHSMLHTREQGIACVGIGSSTDAGPEVAIIRGAMHMVSRIWAPKTLQNCAVKMNAKNAESCSVVMQRNDAPRTRAPPFRSLRVSRRILRGSSRRRRRPLPALTRIAL
jgi:hypothetical protein